MRYLLLSVVLMLCVVQSGCLSLTAAETGRTVGDRVLDLSVSVDSGTYSATSLGGSRDAERDEDVLLELVPIIELGGTFGVTETTDFGVRFNSALFVSSHLKQQVVGTKSSPFALSLSVEGGFNPGAFAIQHYYGYASVPLYAWLHPSESVALYVVPRYTIVAVGIILAPSESDPADPASWKFPSLAYGVMLGERNRFVVEVGHAREGSLWPSQVSVGMRIRFDWWRDS